MKHIHWAGNGQMCNCAIHVVLSVIQINQDISDTETNKCQMSSSDCDLLKNFYNYYIMSKYSTLYSDIVSTHIRNEPLRHHTQIMLMIEFMF